MLTTCTNLRKKRCSPQRIHLQAVAGRGDARKPSGPVNVRFKYMYRDASNYKQHGDAVFTNNTLLSLDEIEKQVRSCLKDGEFFIAGQVNLEERFFDALHDDDHPWHEFAGLEETSEPAFDPSNWNTCRHHRDVREFLANLEQAQRAGWDETNVRADMKELLERQKAALRRRLTGDGHAE